MGRAQSDAASLASMRRRLNSFNHAHKSYHTLFGVLHVRYAACLIGFVYLLALCALLVVCLIYSQAKGSVREMYGPKISLKLVTIPIGVAFITIFYLFIGIIQQKANMLFPFIALQIFFSFVIAILLMIVFICWLCDARKVLHIYIFLGRHKPYKQEHDKLPIAIICAVLSCLLLLQVWTTRAVCGCYRYFTDVARHASRVANFV